MIILKTQDEMNKMRKAGIILAKLHKELQGIIKPGISTMQINDFAERFITQQGAELVTKGYKGYPFGTCTSVNDVIAHGFANDNPLQEGDIVKVDVVCRYNGWCADTCKTYAVGRISPQAERLIRVTHECMELGISKAVVGNRIGDITHAIQEHAEQAGYSVVRDLYAHGIGRSMHEDPSFPHAGKPGRGIRLQEGMVFTIEPMINEGKLEMFVELDGWTAKTYDGSLSAQFEHTIAVTKDGPWVLTADEE